MVIFSATVLRFFLLVSLGFISDLAIAKSLPEKFALAKLEGGTLKAEHLQGKYTIMQFWASWCTSCGPLMIVANKLTKQKPAARYVSVSVDEDLKSAQAYFEKQPEAIKKLRDKAYYDVDTKLAEQLEVKALPSLFVISPNGELLLSITGHPDKAQLEEIEKIIGAPTPVAKVKINVTH